MSTLPPDPYKALGVSKDAQIPEIRLAHRKLVLKCHPDKVQDPTLKAQKQDEFQRVQQAYELLSDDRERQKYDDQVKVAELRKQFQQKANISAQRSSPRAPKYAEFVVHAEPRQSSFKTSAPQSPLGRSPKAYPSTRRYGDDAFGGGVRIVDPEEIRAYKRDTRDASYADKPSKREVEREREKREKERRDREKERERQRYAEEELRREERLAEKAHKEARRLEKKTREKQLDKEIKRATADKRRKQDAYVEPYAEEVPPPKSEKKKSSSSKKHDSKRERSSHRDEVPIVVAPEMPPMPTMPSMSRADSFAKMTFSADAAREYIARSQRHPSKSYHMPAVPTPPPAQESVYHTPSDDEPRRSAAKARRGSSDTVKSARSQKKSSREFTAEPEPMIMNASPSSRFPASFSGPPMASSPSRADLPRRETMPTEPSISRPPLSVPRSNTYSYGEASPRGRSRSRHQAQVQIDEESSEDDYERERRRAKHRSKKSHPVESAPRETVRRYQYDAGDKFSGSSLRQLEPEDDYYSRPRMPREGSYASTSGASFKVKTAQQYSYEHVNYANRYPVHAREDYEVYG